MSRFLIQRILLVIPVLIGVSIAAFAMSHLVPGDPVSVMLGDRATAEDTARLRAELGLDDPILVQYGRYVRDAVTGDLGTSIRSGQPVLSEIMARFPSTLQLTVAACLVSSIVGIGLGLAAATSKRGSVDASIMLFAAGGLRIR